MALRRPTFRRVRLVMLNLWVYLAPLAAVIFLFHLDRFDASAPITYTFFGIAILMTVSSTWYLLRPPRSIVPDDWRDSLPPGLMVRTWLGMVALLTGVWGLALFLSDKGPSSLIWGWPGDLLSSRLIGVMLLTIAIGSVYSLRFVDVSKVMLAMTITYSAGLAMASFWNILAGKPIKVGYLVIFGIIFLGSIASLFLDSTVKPGWLRKKPT
jgi:hypothetical protein